MSFYHEAEGSPKEVREKLRAVHHPSISGDGSWQTMAGIHALDNAINTAVGTTMFMEQEEMRAGHDPNDLYLVAKINGHVDAHIGGTVNVTVQLGTRPVVPQTFDGSPESRL